MKRCTASCVIRKMKIKTMRYPYTPIPVAEIQNTDSINEDVEQEHSLLVGMKNGIANIQDNLVVSSKSTHTLTIWSRNCASWHLPKWLKTYVYTKAWTWMFIEVLFIVVKSWKESRCPSVAKQTVVHLNNVLQFITQR